MKQAIFILIAATLVLTGAATAQFQDILGPHNLNGHGCATCHTPHSGAAGNGGSDTSTGINYLWGRDFYATTYQTFDGGSLTIPGSFTDTDVLFHTAACLACHDGNLTIAGMTGQSFETVDGQQVPTYLATTGGNSLENDHPVHVTYNPDGSRNWKGTVDANGSITWDVTDPYNKNFNDTYGHPIRFYGVAGTPTGSAYVECSTCHNPHAMNRARYKLGTGTTIYKTSKFFVRGWYDADNPASNSATQFCRSCHFSKSNEYQQVNSVTN
jgi:hypothetical protein